MVIGIFCYRVVCNMPEGNGPMQCPVCARDAQNLTPNTLDGVVVGCKACGSYRVAGGAFHGLMQLNAEARAAALHSAKLAAQYGWPMIDSACVRVRQEAAS